MTEQEKSLQDQSQNKSAMQVGPKGGDGWEKVYNASSSRQQKENQCSEKPSEYMRTGQQMHLCQSQSNGNTKNSQPGIVVRLRQLKQKPEGHCSKKEVEDNHSRNSSPRVNKCHKNFRQPFVGYPWVAVSRVTENVFGEHSSTLEHDFPDLDVPKSVAVEQS